MSTRNKTGATEGNSQDTSCLFDKSWCVWRLEWLERLFIVSIQPWYLDRGRKTLLEFAQTQERTPVVSYLNTTMQWHGCYCWGHWVSATTWRIRLNSEANRKSETAMTTDRPLLLLLLLIPSSLYLRAMHSSTHLTNINSLNPQKNPTRSVLPHIPPLYPVHRHRMVTWLLQDHTRT